jgi:hypothetical protein
MKTNKELKQIQKSLVGQRFTNKKSLQAYLEMEINVEKIELEENVDNVFFTECDYNLQCELTLNEEEDLNIVIFYLFDRQGQIFITEAYIN